MSALSVTSVTSATPGASLLRATLVIILSVALNSCVSRPTAVSVSNDTHYLDIERRVLAAKPGVERFLTDGPIAITTIKDYQIKVMDEPIVVADFYFHKAKGRAPLIIIQHGNMASKRYHSQQAARLATWGFQVLVLSQKKTNRWLRNGRDLGRIVKLMHLWPNLLPAKFNPDRIFLVGHSFGGSASAIAAAGNPLVKGIIWLDPALYRRAVKGYLRRIDQPVVLIGADLKIFRSKSRHLFYNLVKGQICEVSIQGATHFDAQQPSMPGYASHKNPRYRTSTARQNVFTAAIVSAAFSLQGRSPLSYAAKAFRKDGKTFAFSRVRQKP